MKVYIFLFFGLIHSAMVFAQKAIIDASIFGKWESVSTNNFNISNDGNYVLYEIKNRPVGSNTLVVRSSQNNSKIEFTGTSNYGFTADNKYAVIQLKNDSLCLLALKALKIKQSIPHVSSFALSPGRKAQWIAYQSDTGKKALIVRDLTSGKKMQFDSVASYLFNPEGTAILICQNNKTAEGAQSLNWVTLEDGDQKGIWAGTRASWYTFDNTGGQLAFIAEANTGTRKTNSIYYFNPSLNKAAKLIDDKTAGIDSNLEINGNDRLVFSQDGKRIFFTLIEKNDLPHAAPGAINLDVWSYKDKELQSFQLSNVTYRKKYACVTEIRRPELIRLERNGEELRYEAEHPYNDGQFIFLEDYKGTTDYWWDQKYQHSFYVISTVDGTQKLVKENARLVAYLPASPDDQWLIYFDQDQHAYFSYDPVKGLSRNLTAKLPFSVLDQDKQSPFGVAGWLQNGSALLIYDEYDLWLLDPSGNKAPINITNGFGRKHHIRLRLMANDGLLESIPNDTRVFLTAFDTVTKYNGVMRTTISKKGDPESLSFGPYNQYRVDSQIGAYSHYYHPVPLKAKNSNTWLVLRETATESPNLYLTRDFKTFKAISNVHPEKKYNWLSSELFCWKTFDGRESAGVLYKPENLDVSKKYPVILLYYDRKSDNLYDYFEPEATGSEINIPYFVSRGYLVLTPDIFYKTGNPGHGVFNSVVSAARELMKLPFVDPARMGIDGHSFGAWETNYLVTHTNIFAAAAESEGVSDIISSYGTLRIDDAPSQAYFEKSQGRMGGSLWQNLQMYIENSPVFNADKVTTPLLMMNNKNDMAVRWVQGVELFTALRRLGKPAWMLQYDEGEHGVFGKDAEDYTIRLTQFFDHYLKGAPPPKWMTEGIPARMKGIVTGYELDTSGKLP